MRCTRVAVLLFLVASQHCSPSTQPLDASQDSATPSDTIDIAQPADSPLDTPSDGAAPDQLPPPDATPGAGSSLRFFGTGNNDVDRVKIRLDGASGAVNVGLDFTLEFWLRARASENSSRGCVPGGVGWINGNIVLDRDVFGTGDRGDWGVSLSGGRMAFGVARGSEEQSICGTTMVADDRWHHIAATRDATTGELTVWVDGRMDGRGVGPTGDVSYRLGRSTMAVNDPFLVLGAEKHDAGSEYPSLSGWLDELRISNVVRYRASFEPVRSNFVADGSTVALYHFDDAMGTMATDSARGNHGVLNIGGTMMGPLWSSDTPF